jgi:exodeoxyribonuclease V alpha subunit
MLRAVHPRGNRTPTQKPLFPKPASPTGAVTVEGGVARVTFENDETGFRVLKVDVEGKSAPETWVGVFPPAPGGTRVRATGRYERDNKHGEQLRVDTLLVVAPGTLDGIVKFLGSGMIKGVGSRYARRIVDTFGLETLDVLDKNPERLAEVNGLGDKRARVVAKAWEEHRVVGAIMIFLQSHGATPALATRIYKRFGPRAMDIVTRSPYRLALDVWGVGFKTADRIARSLGVSADAPERAQAGVLHTLHELSTRGHVYCPRRELAELASRMLERDPDEVEGAIDALASSGHVVCERTDDAVFPTALHEAETRLAKRLLQLSEHPSKAISTTAAERAIAEFEARTKVILAPAQREAIELAAKHKVLVITGGPGVGKTTIVRAILALFELEKRKTRLAAPTGRAAKRMSEATGREATTLHRLLEFDPKNRAFSRNEDNAIVADVLVVDEASMLDLSLADALTQAVADDARLLLVGDVDQLPSVGPGAVLRDLIASKVIPTARLTQIFRQAEGSLIVKNAHRINAGEVPVTAQGETGEFYVIEAKEAGIAADLIHRLVTDRIPKRFGLDPRRDIQVLTPMHKGEVGIQAINDRLQAALNPDGAQVGRGAKVLRLGDKVMQLKNSYDKEVYNGDVGFLRAIDPDSKIVTVRFDDRDVPYEEADLDELTLAYATSIHKSQGSEYPCVVLPLLTQHFVMLSRNLVYTGVTRGKRLVVLVADPRAIAMALAETRKDDRRTLLADRLRGC